MISNGLLGELEKKKKPGDNDFLERAESLLAIQNIILQLQNLKKMLQEEQLMIEITSYNFLNRIPNFLSTADYIDLSSDLVAANLDNRVAAGPKALELTLNRLRNTILVLKPVMENMKGKAMSRSVHTIGTMEKPAPPESPNLERCGCPKEHRETARMYRIDDRLVKTGKWGKPELQFPCPLDSHTHELFQYETFLTMSLQDRQQLSKE